MILRFKTAENAEYLNINTTAEVYNYGETPGAYYIPLEDNDYLHILTEMDFNCYGYDEYLGLGVAEEYHPFLKTGLNAMCRDCKHLYIMCSGTHNEIYSGCVWKDAPADHLESFTRNTGGMLGGTE